MTAPATILFTDVEDSTGLANRVGDAECRRLLGAHESVIRAEIAAAAGREIKTMGDGFMVAFDDAGLAVACAVTVQRRLVAEASGVVVRMGLHAGEVTEQGGDLFGATVNAAARVAAKARGGQILVSEDLLGALDGLDSVDRGLYWLKGFPERWRLHEVLWREGGGAAVPGAAAGDRTPFVGREDERADLRRALESAAAGTGGLVLIGGEPGVGKTRLAIELASEADGMAVRVLTGHCVEREGAAAYTPWIEVLEQALARAQSPEAFRGLLGDSAGEIARIVPELRRVYDDIPPPLELPPEQERRYLFNSIRDFIGRAAGIRPLLIVLDDLHWADESTLLLLEHVAETVASVPVLIVGTYRDVELEVGRPLARTIEDLRRRGLATRVSLRRLDEKGVEGMLRALTGQDPPPGLVAAIYNESDGNAFFVEEVFRHLLEEGRLLDAEGRWLPDVSVAEFEVPESVRLVIGRRLERVSDPARKLLTAAAVLGRVFRVQELELVAGADEDALLDGLEEAERARLVAPIGDRGETFEFGHELIRQTLLADVSTLRRQRLHLKAADAIDTGAAGRESEVAADLAYHLTQAGAGAAVERTGSALRLAGERALEAVAFEDAVRYLEQAASLPGALDERGRAEVMHGLGLAYAGVGRWEDANQAWGEALDAFERLKDEETVGRIAYPISYQLIWGARFEDSLIVVGRGLAALEGRDSLEHARLLANGGLLFGGGGYAEAAESMTADALEMAERLGDPRVLGEVLSAQAIVAWQFCRFEDTIALGVRAAELLREANALWELAAIQSFLSVGMAFNGRLEQAQSVADEAIRIGDLIGHPGAHLTAHRGRVAARFMQTGDLQAVDKAMREDLEIASVNQLPWIAQSYAWEGTVAFLTGDWDRARASMEEGLRREPPAPVFTGWERAPMLRLLAHLGDEAGVMELWAREGWELPEPGEPTGMGAGAMIAYGVEAFAILGRDADAAALYPHAAQFARIAYVRIFDLAFTERFAGIAAACAGDLDAAERHLQAAARLAESWPNRLEQAETARWRAWTLLRRGGPEERERADELLRSAITGYRELGMPKHAELAEGMLSP